MVYITKSKEGEFWDELVNACIHNGPDSNIIRLKADISESERKGICEALVKDLEEGQFVNPYRDLAGLFSNEQIEKALSIVPSRFETRG